MVRITTKAITGYKIGPQGKRAFWKAFGRDKIPAPKRLLMKLNKAFVLLEPPGRSGRERAKGRPHTIGMDGCVHGNQNCSNLNRCELDACSLSDGRDGAVAVALRNSQYPLSSLRTSVES